MNPVKNLALIGGVLNETNVVTTTPDPPARLEEVQKRKKRQVQNGRIFL